MKRLTCNTILLKS